MSGRARRILVDTIAPDGWPYYETHWLQARASARFSTSRSMRFRRAIWSGPRSSGAVVSASPR